MQAISVVQRVKNPVANAGMGLHLTHVSSLSGLYG